jgi:predicted aldo/keto reductase-like oxidoreductase
MVDTFMESGFCHFDTAYFYHGEQSASAFREAVALRYDRDQFTVTDKMPIWLVEREEQLNEIFEEQLKRCGVEYFDFYWIHALSHISTAITIQWQCFFSCPEIVRFPGFLFVRYMCVLSDFCEMLTYGCTTVLKMHHILHD